LPTGKAFDWNDRPKLPVDIVTMRTCSSGKRTFDTAVQAEQALLELQGRSDYASGNGPVGYYLCPCGGYHLTSKGPINSRLADQMRNGNIDRQREAGHWLKKLDKK
jgi:hypothetical protein